MSSHGETPQASGRAGSRRGRRGPRRATGGTTISQGEPERLAGLDLSSGRTASRDKPAEAETDARGRWILEQRPPHWG